MSELDNRKMVEMLVRRGVIKKMSVRDAMMNVPRELFVWEGYEDLAYEDQPLPLGDTGQTISAPHMVAIMLEELDVKPGNIILEVGSGSGYNAACLSFLTGERGKVISLEIDERLVNFARKNVEKLGLKNVQIILSDGSLGYPPYSETETYDRIVVTAAAPSIPKYLTFQLKKNGIMLIPVGKCYSQVLKKVTNDSEGRTGIEDICDVVFVPMVGA
jgi:protein-L-isoaspartate(D-aspartate) O-methyltransferase